MQQRQVAEQRVSRPRMGQRGTDRGGHRAVDAGDTAVREHRHVPRAERPRATRRGPGSTSRRRAARHRAARRPAPGPAAGRRALPGRRGRRRAPWPRRGRRRASSPSNPAAGAMTARPRRRGRSRRRPASCGPPGRRGRRRPTCGSASSRCTGRCRVGRPATTTWAGRRPSGSAPSSHGPARNPASHTPRRRLGDDRQPPVADLGRRTRAGDHQRRRRRVERQRCGLHPGPGHRGPRHAAGPTRRSRSPVGHQRFGEGQVDVHRAGGCAERGGHRPPDGRAPRPVLPLGVARGSCRQREPHGVAEDPGLDDRLVRARADQLRRAVRGEDEQRHAGVRRLEHGRVQVRHGRARRRHHGHRPARPQREARARGSRRCARRSARAAAAGRRRPRRAARTRAGRCGSRGTGRRR